MTTDDLGRILARTDFCQGLDPEHLALLAGCAENVHIADGSCLFRAHTPADCAWLIRAGRVVMQLHDSRGAVPLETAEAGEWVGWSWLDPPYEWHFDAVASGVVRALRFDGTCLREKCTADPAFGFALTRRMLRQASKRLERSRLQALDVYGSPAR